MIECEAGPSSTISLQDEELNELALGQGVTVWGTNHQTLEAQALQELDLFTQNGLEEGEVVETIKPQNEPSLDVNSYIKRQEELRKRQEYQRTLLVHDKNKQIIEKFHSKRKRRRKSPKEKTKLKRTKGDSSGSEYLPSEGELDEIEYEEEKLAKTYSSSGERNNVEKLRDDGCLVFFKARLEEYYKQLEAEADGDLDDIDFYTIKGGLKVPFRIWHTLYSYQQDGVRWLWKLHEKGTGGLLGDEMGLGKTVQVIAFLAALQYSKVGRFQGLGPTLVVCPATVIHQWVSHFHQWAPEFRVAILHQSGTFPGKKTELIKEIQKDRGILVSSYLGVLKYKSTILDLSWDYLILDEGHKIRNCNAKISKTVKHIRTPHRLLLTGSPMQNNLQELWSLFDFTNPDMLGDLATFMAHFNQPIVQGGFTNATPLQEATALSVATTLKNIISPFLLRRTKSEVQEHISLPNKSEQVLFCSLTDSQYDLYKGYLMSEHVGAILGQNTKNWFGDNYTRARVLIAITVLRKICNHPDIYLNENEEKEAIDSFGYYRKSGKMVVVSALLKIWKRQKHRVLLFTQSRAMVAVFEAFLAQQGYKFLKMDGGTSVGTRQPLINKFNEDCSYDVFLLTTRVGGLGVNLTGADRVIIYDPDWNPATDTQARERAWRIGQDKQVTIYRLLSAGTIEEKMYQRQVWKQLLSNKILLDPKTRRFFKSSSLHDLFSIPERAENAPETTNIFRESRVKIQERLKKKKQIEFSEDKIKEMKNLAQQIAKTLTKPEVKTSYQLELEEERRKKKIEREELKKIPPCDLLHLNRRKNGDSREPDGNCVDDCSTNVSFSKALELSAETAELYHNLKSEDKIRNVRRVEKDEAFKKIIDESGIVDGEKIDGLVKMEVKKKREKKKKKSECQDEYILEKLFSRKGVSGALQHDAVIDGGIRTQSLKVQNEAKLKADKALEALRKSRLDKWRW